MAQPGTIVRFIYAPERFCDAMIQANIALSDGRAKEAIRHYTEVLYELQPAHVCAFLNRSMAYLELGYHDLAVMDAYRACIAANELRKNTVVANNRLCKLAKYIAAERLHIDNGDKWTKLEQRNVGIGWMKSPLASIVISATPEVTASNGPGIPPFEPSRKSIVPALEIRAVYRLCGSLFMVGNGARMDALSLIDDARSRLYMSPWESDWFHKLGNEIMFDFDFGPIDPKELSLLGPDAQDKRDERLMKQKENLKARTTHFGYGDYPWDPYEPKLGESRSQTQAQTWVESYTASCSALIVQPEETDNTTAEGFKPYAELRAKEDINSGDFVLSERTISNVTTSIAEQIEANRDVSIYYCYSCASLLAVPQQFPHQYQSNTMTQGNPSTGAAQTSPGQDFTLVNKCSAACRELSEGLENGLCGTKLEQKIRKSQFQDLKPRSITDRKTQCLRDLLFVRHITRAISLCKNPLQINDLVFATTGPNMRGIENSEVEPWSFVSHVVRPIRYLHQLFLNMGTDQFLNLSQVDGWVINTLLLKINRAMRISEGPRYVKRFGADGILDSAFGPWDKRWEPMIQLAKEQEDKSVWVASIESLFNMIRVADPVLGETPNVDVVWREGVNVYAVKTQDGGPAIKAGETLLRAADDVEDPPQNEELYTGDAPDPVDEKHDDEEVHSGDTSVFLEEDSADEDGLDAVDDEEENDEDGFYEVDDEAYLEDENDLDGFGGGSMFLNDVVFQF